MSEEGKNKPAQSHVTVGRLARKYGLSRSTLLYYHRIGLLRPSSGGGGAYRYYSASDVLRLEHILSLREAGLALADIKRVLDAPEAGITPILERRLEELNEEVARLRNQQRLLIGLLKKPDLAGRVGVMNKTTWTELLRASGFSERDMIRWHGDFERTSPDRHQAFLEFLCIPPQEIDDIRELSRRVMGEKPGG